MGLDMYLNGRKFFWKNFDNPELTPKEDVFPLKEHILELGYWRKHPNLHGYIVQSFADGVDECQPIELTRDDLLTIIAVVKSGSLPHTEGFFFGTSDGSERDADIAILEKAVAWLDSTPKKAPEARLPRESRDVFYQASW